MAGELLDLGSGWVAGVPLSCSSALEHPPTPPLCPQSCLFPPAAFSCLLPCSTPKGEPQASLSAPLSLDSASCPWPLPFWSPRPYSLSILTPVLKQLQNLLSPYSNLFSKSQPVAESAPRDKGFKSPFFSLSSLQELYGVEPLLSLSDIFLKPSLTYSVKIQLSQHLGGRGKRVTS